MSVQKSALLLCFFIGAMQLIQAQKIYSDTLLPVFRHGKWGYISSQGSLVIPFQYDGADYWGSGKFGKIKENGKWKLLTREGAKIELKNSTSVTILSDNVIALRKSDGWGIFETSGKRLFEQSFDWVTKLNDNLFSFGKNDSAGLADVSGKICIPAVFDSIYILPNNWIITERCGEQGVADRSGREIIRPNYNSIRFYQAGFISATYGEARLAGVFDSTGKQLINCEWPEITSISNNFIVLDDEGENGNAVYFTSNQKLLDSLGIRSFVISGKFMMATTDSGKGVLDHRGNWFMKPEHSMIFTQHGCFVACKNEQWNIFSAENNLLNKKPFKDVRRLNPSSWLVQNQAGKYDILSADGDYLGFNADSADAMNNKMKLYKNGELISIELDTTGKIISKNTYSNIVSVRIGNFEVATEKRKTNEDATADGRWFYDPVPNKWGLKTEDGKIMIKPYFDEIKHIPKYGLTKVYKKTREAFKVSANGIDLIVGGLAGIVDPVKGKIIVPLEFVDVLITGDTTAPLLFGITRSLFFQYVEKNNSGETQLFSWVDQTYSKKVRVAKGSPLSSVRRPHDCLVTNRSGRMAVITNPLIKKEYEDRYNRREFDFIKLYSINTRWAFLPSDKKKRSYYDDAKSFENNVAIVKSNKWGIINERLSFVTLPQYDSILSEKTKKGIYYRLVRNDSSFAAVDTNGFVYSLPNGDYSKDFDGNYFEYKFANTVHYSRPFGYTKEINKENSIYPQKQDLKWGYINLSSGKMLPAVYSKAVTFSDGLGMVKQKGKAKFIDADGTPIDTNVYKDARPFVNGRAKVKTDEGWTVIDKEGTTLFTEHFKSIKICSNNTYIVARKNRVGVVDEEAELIPFNYEYIKQFGQDHFLGIKGKRIYLLSTFDKPVLLKNAGIVNVVSCDCFSYQKKDKWMLCNGAGKILKTLDAGRIYPFKENLAARLTAKMWQAIDTAGNVIFQSRYNLKNGISEGFFTAFNANEFVYLDENGIDRFGKKFSCAYPFQSGVARVCQNKKWGLIDHAGNWLITPRFRTVKNFSNGLALVKRRSVEGICDSKGTPIIPAETDYAGFSADGFIRAEHGSFVSWYRSDGTLIWSGKPEEPIAGKGKE